MVVLQALRSVLPPDIAEIREGDLSQLAGCGSGVVGKRRGHARRIVGDAGKEVGLTVVAALRKRRFEGLVWVKAERKRLTALDGVRKRVDDLVSGSGLRVSQGVRGRATRVGDG